MARAQRRHTEAVKRADQRSTRVLWGGMLVGGLIAVGIALAPSCQAPAEETVAPVDITPSETSRPVTAPAIEELRLRVIGKYPHATDAFTQGLIWHDGLMYESTGQYGKSSLRKVRLEDGKVLAQRELDPKFFGEGLERVGDRLVQLTWRSGLAFVSDLATLEARETLSYRGEGWGLCYDGSVLVMSDGSSMLEFRDPGSMELLGEVTVLRDGRPVPKLNELECVGSEIYANIWRHDEIIRIDRESGRVTGTIDASELLSRDEARRADVLNGIAYKPESKTFLLTGKLWPHVFEVELVPR
ncbi:MAG: glutaminyl-peptide cyclotransferase [Deltaproteobacteria bacterium]